MKKVLGIIIGVFLLFVLIGLVADNPEVEDSSYDDPVVAEEETEDEGLQETQEEAEEIYSIGDAVTMGNLEFAVNSVRWDYGDEFISPDQGERWLVVDATIDNLSDESEAISSMIMFDLVDMDGYSQDLSIVADTRGQLDGELGANRTMSGEIAFTVQEEESEWEFIFEPNLFGFGQAIFSISEDDIEG